MAVSIALAKEATKRLLAHFRYAGLLAVLVACAAVLVGELPMQSRLHSIIYFSDFHNDYNAALALRRGMHPLAPAALWIHTSFVWVRVVSPCGTANPPLDTDPQL